MMILGPALVFGSTLLSAGLYWFIVHLFVVI
jgi:hypothetical protein